MLVVHNCPIKEKKQPIYKYNAQLDINSAICKFCIIRGFYVHFFNNLRVIPCLISSGYAGFEE